MAHEADSFIDEVSEEVRRDRLYSTFRKYGWIAITLVVLIVGGTAFNEYRKSSNQAAAEALGDALMAALQKPTAEERVAALSAVPVEGDMANVLALLTSAEQLAGEDRDGAVATLRPLAESAAAPQVYSDMAAFKMLLIGGEAITPDVRSQTLDRLSQPGAPFRPLALEQQALDLAAAGDTDAAIEAARAVLQEPALTQGLFQRMSQLIVALGGDPAAQAG